MSQPRRILIVEDSADDAELVAQALRRGGCDLSYRRVANREAMRAALERETWDLVIADYSTPRLNGPAALQVLRDMNLDLPFILISNAVGKVAAEDAMKCGADDYILKNSLARLPFAVERELRDYQVRAQRNRAEARYRSLIDRVPVGVFSVSPQGQIFEANPALIEMLGFSDADSLKRVSIAKLWLREEEFTRLVAIITEAGIVKNFEMQIRRPDGSVIWCEQNARAVYDAAGKVSHYEGVLVDVTARKRAEEEANRARDRVRDLALEAARLRSEFIASMSHEIRTPLVGIIGTGELLARCNLTAEQRRQIEIIQSSGELLLTIVNDILDFSKLAAGRVVMEQLDFDLIQMMESLIDAFAAAARAKGLELALRLDPKLPAGVRGDPSRLRQILNNLVANAIKFTEHGEVTVTAAKVEDAADDVLVRFEVVDTGIGIPLAAQRRLFQPFVQAEGSTSRRFGGTGLGLVIAAKLVEQMGGEIGFESAPGKGSNFHFTARLELCGNGEHAETAEIAGAPRTAVGIEPQDWRRAVRVLLVDDNLVNRKIGEKQLAALGYTSQIADSARRGLEILSNGDCDIVLMDCEMPEIDGYEAVAEIRRREGAARHTVVIALTAHATEDDRARCLDAGMDDYLSKPVKLHALEEMLDTWSRRKLNLKPSAKQ